MGGWQDNAVLGILLMLQRFTTILETISNNILKSAFTWSGQPSLVHCTTTRLSVHSSITWLYIFCDVSNQNPNKDYSLFFWCHLTTVRALQLNLVDKHMTGRWLTWNDDMSSDMGQRVVWERGAYLCSRMSSSAESSCLLSFFTCL